MCAVFRGISIDQEMLRLVTGHGFRGTVHSVYDLAVNFYDQLGGLNCVVSHNLDNAPGTLRINLPGLCTFKTIGVMNGEPVRTKGGRMFLGSKIVIDLWKINIWQGVLPCFSPEAKQPVLSRNLQALKKVILACGLPGGIKAFYTGKKASEVRDFFSVELKKRAGNLMDALVSHNLPAAREAGLTLLGFGNGQTPSGDDFLAGLITVWNMPAGPFDSWYVELGKYLAAAARERTTLLSQATLEKAAKGYVREKVINLLTALLNATEKRVAQASLEVLKIGSSSGTDLVVGLATGLEFGLSLTRSSSEGK